MICPICAWEDDAVQLANPACGGGANRESLIDAQRAMLAEYPLTVTAVVEIKRDKQWRLLNETERDTAETEQVTKYWMNKATYDPAMAYWNKTQPIK